MKILKIITLSGFSIELSLDEQSNNTHMVIRGVNGLTQNLPIDIEITHDETCELIDFLDEMADQMSVEDLISPKSDESEMRFNRDYIIRDTFTGAFIWPPQDGKPIIFPDPKDIQEWLDNLDNDDLAE